MKIQIIEKAVLTREEMNALNKADSIIGQLYGMVSSGSELGKQLDTLITALSDFIDDVEVILEDD